MFANMKVATRLSIAFGLVVLLLITVATVTMRRMALMNEDMRTITEVNNAEVSHAVALRAAAFQEQTTGVNQINTTVTQLSQTTQTNAAAAEQLSATAEEMSGQAARLKQTMAFFKSEGAGKVAAVSRGGGAAVRTARKPKQALRIAGNAALKSHADDAEIASF